MSSMAIEHWGVTVMDFTGVTEDDDLGIEGSTLEGGFVICMGSDVTSFEFGDGDTFDIETNVITWDSLFEFLMMHLNRFDLRSQATGDEFDDLTWFKDTSLDSSDGDGTDTGDLVDILEWESKRFVQRSLRGFQFI